MSQREFRPMDENGFRALRAEVVKRACNDYLKTSKAQVRNKIRRWFRSDAFSFFCDADADSILKQLDILRKEKKKRLIFDEED